MILQARLGSSRLPGKVLLNISGKPLIYYQIERIKLSKKLCEIVVAIPEGAQDDPLNEYLVSQGVSVSRGSMQNVYSRFRSIIEQTDAEVIIRSTADCPLFMSDLLDNMLEQFDNKPVDYFSNAIKPTFPDGLDIEIFSRDAFMRLAHLSLTEKQQEHVTLIFYDGSQDFGIYNFESPVDLSQKRWTVDYPEDFEFIKTIFEKTRLDISLPEVLDFLAKNPEVVNKMNADLRNTALKGED